MKHPILNHRSLMIRIITILLFSAFLSCGQSQSKNDAKNNEPEKPGADWKTLTGSDFSASYPPDWLLDESKNMGTSFIIYAHDGSGQRFRENINLMVQDLSSM